MDEYYMKIALKQAQKALKHDEVPVGAVIVRNNKIISQAYNKKEKNNNAILHAELITISKACKKLKKWRLDDCVLYTTMEPCMMCSGAIDQCRIKKIVYGTKNDNFGCTQYLNSIEIISQVCEEECRNLVQLFFKKKR